MAAFSSRGGPLMLPGALKPDITAPGVQILAGTTPAPAAALAAPGELFQTLQGTSMSAPHVAGAAALVKALRPGRTPGRIKSALMTGAVAKRLVKEDGRTPADAFDAGAGRLDLRRIALTGLTFDASAADYATHAGDLWNVNQPSLYLPGVAGFASVTRTVRSELAADSVWQLTVSGPADLTIAVPRSLAVSAGATAAFAIGVNAFGVPPGQVRHAVLTLRSGARVVRFPITVTTP
jgi:subtilisin family serine protease